MSDAAPEKYPEHVKMRAVKDKSQAIGDFLVWLEEAGMEICERDDGGELCGISAGTERLLARYFDIDLAKISAEKDALCDTLVDAQIVTTVEAKG